MIRIPTKTHGILDYVMGAALLAAPLLLKNKKSANGQQSKGANREGTVLAAAGGLMLSQSLMTDYELGVVKAIDMPVHLTMDVAAGLMLAASPWLFNMDRKMRLPLAMLGLGEAAVALLTNVEPGDPFLEELGIEEEESENLIESFTKEEESLLA